MFDDSGPGEFTLSKPEGDGAFDNVDAQDFSAADYDPNADKIAEEQRISKKGPNGEMMAADYGEAPSHVERKLKVDQQPAKRDALDMFADEDDIFAEPREQGKMDVEKPLVKPVRLTCVGWWCLVRKANQSLGQAVGTVGSELATLIDNWDDAEGYYRRYSALSRGK
jgi:hypothetical protein